MNIKSIQVGGLATNCYFLIDETSGKAAVIDPGDEGERILAELNKLDVQVEYILLTHGHYDHIGAVARLHEALPQAEVYIHKADSKGTGFHVVALADQIAGLRYYDDGDILTLGALAIRVIHTPGHTPGGVTLQVEDVLFTGDTLFAGSMGRSDFPGGNTQQLFASLKKLAQLEGDYQVLPGHEMTTTLDVERKSNVFVLEALK